jgi:hypothetical protein
MLPPSVLHGPHHASPHSTCYTLATEI